ALSLLQPADSGHLGLTTLLSVLVLQFSPLDSVLDPIVQAGIRGGVYPGAALIVGRHDTSLFAQGYGRLTWSAMSPAVSVDSTFWDVASLTKVVATTPALMLLVEQGKVALDSPVVHYLPAFNSPGTSGITVRHLLTHTSGLRATLPLREAPDSAAACRGTPASSQRHAGSRDSHNSC